MGNFWLDLEPRLNQVRGEIVPCKTCYAISQSNQPCASATTHYLKYLPAPGTLVNGEISNAFGNYQHFSVDAADQVVIAQPRSGRRPSTVNKLILHRNGGYIIVEWNCWPLVPKLKINYEW